MKIAVFVVLFARVELRLRRAVRRPDSRALESHDVLGSHRYDIRRQPTRLMLHHRAHNQLVAAATIKITANKWIASGEPFDVGADQIGVGNRIVCKLSLLTGALL